MHLDVHEFNVANQSTMATLGPVLIRVFRGATEIADVDLGCKIVESLLERWPIAGVLAIAHHGTPLPDAVTRKYASRNFGKFGDRLVIVQCQLGLGFWAEAARATAMAIARMIRSHTFVESNVEAAARRMAMEMVGIDPARIIAAHDQLLASLDAAAPSLRT